MTNDYIRKQDAIRLAEQGQVQGFPWQFQMLVRLPPADVAPVVFCKDCVKHNKKIGFDENFHPVWKEDACPLVSWRGKAQGCEFDYQF